jgi:hypothetical protein
MTDADYEERAAIMEFDANLPRVEAERLARLDTVRQPALDRQRAAAWWTLEPQGRDRA